MNSGSTSDVTRGDVERLFSNADEPYTTSEVAERLKCPERSAERALETSADRGEVRTKEVVDGTRIWWRPPDEAESDDQQSELREFGAFVRAVKDYAIFMLNPDGTVASWNEGARRIKGYSEDEIVGRHFSTFYTEEDTESGVPETNLDAAAREGHIEDEGWRVRQDGTRFWANVVITAIRDVDSTLQGFTKVTRDMTEQREFELQLRRERDLTEQILETAPVSICVLDSNREFVRANQQALDLLGADQPSVEGSSIESKNLYDGAGNLVPNDERPWTRVIDTGQPVYDFHCRSDWTEGDRRWLSINVVPLEGMVGDDNGVVVAIEDITAQKERERQLEERKSELETELSEILGRISDAFFALDDEWRFTHLNERAAELFGLSQSGFVGRSFWEEFPERSDGRLWEEFCEAMETQAPVNFELYDERLEAWLEYNVYPSKSGLSIYIHDITERKEYQRKLEESNERLEQFAYASSHDLQEPLRMVSSYLRLIENRYGDELDEEGREFLEFAVDGADRMRDMIRSLLKYSRVETRGEPLEPVDLNDVLDEVRNDLERAITESDAVVTAETLPTVKGDDSQLRQVFQNLLENAIEYSGDEPPRVHVAAERSGERWEISVTDEGIGIDSEDEDRVFEVFQRLHTREEYDGTGIGLALCERIVERHGGEISLDSAPGEGSTFSFTLPSTNE
ncbi:PAS domain S-box protein [Halopelagius longus]|uniref:histidine kinase n=1 Tax=Halopelagius longus TaxID=1236180 RepID=A0A1H1FIA0_9EURY|nr:PAS domain S-box protein [Halopelagius longus]RDI70091.1 PAS domain S-box protein [Halopelagius longus]SDR00590.1 PAS domain S-box-containing protein [Halopelagius longus]